MFEALSWRGRERTTAVFERFVAAVRGVLAASLRPTAD
jgi:hypothetical protein